MKRRYPCSRHGFLLMEMILALVIFGMAVTGFTVALRRMGQIASLAQSEMRITRFMDSALTEALSLPTPEEGDTKTGLMDQTRDITITTSISRLDKLENQDGQALLEMYDIQVHASWLENGQRQERSVETWRYGRLYQP